MNTNFSEWTVQRLSEIAEITGGSTPSTSNPEYWDGNIPFVTPTDITSLSQYKYIEKTKRTITEKGLQAISSELLNPGTILLTSRATLGKAAINKVPVVTNQGFANLKPKSGIDVSWLFYFILSQKRELKRLASGSTFKEVSRRSIKRMKVSVPPIVEQRGIAEVLSTFDEAIQRTDTVIKKSEELKRGLMQQLLTRGIGHTEYKETALGMIPETWISSIIDEYCYVTKLAGFEYTKYIKYKEKGEIIALRGINLSDYGLDLSDLRYIDKKTSDFLKRSKLFKNDIIMTFIGVNIGDVVIIPQSDKYHCAPNIAKITVKNEKTLNPLFLLWYLKSHNAQKHIKSLTKSTAKQSINMSEIRTVKLILPPKNEQDVIVDILNQVQQKTMTEKQIFLLFNNIKMGLMRLLLSGKIRVELRDYGLHRIRDSREAHH